MSTHVHHHPDGATMTERHPTAMSVAGLLCLVVLGGLVGLAVGRALVVVVQVLLGVVGQGM